MMMFWCRWWWFEEKVVDVDTFVEGIVRDVCEISVPKVHAFKGRCDEQTHAVTCESDQSDAVMCIQMEQHLAAALIP